MSTAGMTVVVGTNYLNQGGFAHDVAQYIINDGYNPDSLIQDIALIRVQQVFTFSATVRAIGLAKQAPPGGQVVTLSGWGLTSYPGSIPNALQYIKLRTLDVWTCASSNPTSTPVTQRHVCTGSHAGFGACQGDSGGPLIISEDEQIGVVSWGVPCAKGYPDVFTNVAMYRRWIYENTKV